MDGDSLLLIAIFVICNIISAYLAASESSFASVSKIRFKTRADNGDRKAKSVLYIINNFDRALTTILIGINVTHLAAASVATLFVAERWGTSDSVTLITTFVTTFIVFLVSEMIPKSFANDRVDTVAVFSAPILRFLMKILFPLVWIFNVVTRLASKIFKAKEIPSITEEELYDIIDTAEEQGVMNEEQSELLRSVLDFPDTHASDVMTMRDDIAYLDINMSNKELIKRIKDIPHSRIPIVNGSLDNIVGILPARKFLRSYITNPNIDIRTILLKPHFVKCNDSIDELLDTMRQHKIYMGIVRDKNSKVCGIVSIEDFLEELVGEIWDEEDKYDRNFYKLGGNSFFASAMLDVGDVFERMGIEKPDPRISSLKLGVWVSEHFGKLPDKEDSFIYRNVEVTVDKLFKTRIAALTLHIIDDSQSNDEDILREEGGDGK